MYNHYIKFHLMYFDDPARSLSKISSRSGRKLAKALDFISSANSLPARALTID